jgi:hypothetical protein
MATQKAAKWLSTPAIAIVLGVTFAYAQEQKKQDVPYVSTPQIVVDKMLEVAACHEGRCCLRPRQR